MKTLTAVVGLILAAIVGTPREIAAQDLVIVNARILDGKGGVIERGSVVVRGGKIVSVEAGTATVSGVQSIDAQGRTLMPGFIDAHRHIAEGDPAEWLAKRAPRADAGVPRRRLHHRAVRDLSRSGGRTAAADRVGRGEGTAAAGGDAHSARASRCAPQVEAAAVGRGGDPARFDNSRPPLRPTEAAGAIPPADTIKAVESIASRKYDLHQDPHHHHARRTGNRYAQADRQRGQEAQSADDHACGLGDRYARRRRGAPGRARAHAAHRSPRGRRQRGQEDCRAPAFR